MFLRRHRKEAGGEAYQYWSLVRTLRTARGPRHQIVARLGKLDEAEIQRAHGWHDLEALLEGRAPATQLELGELPPPPPRPLWRQVDLRGVRVERLRQFGRAYLGLALWRRLGLHAVLARLLPGGSEDIGWDQIACVLTLGRFCAQPSELALAERWYEETALEDLLGIPLDKINDTRLYRGLDQLLAHKDALCQHLLNRYRDWFGVDYQRLMARALAWLGRGIRTPIRKALLAASVTKETYGRAFGFERMMDTLGAIVGPAKQMRADKSMPIADICRTLRISRPTLYRYLAAA
jgi:hypothetical protein